MAKRSVELEREIQEILSRVPKKTVKTRPELDAEIDAILESMFAGKKVERFEIAKALGYRYPKRPVNQKPLLTPLNVSVLAEIAMGRREFPNQFSSTSAAAMRRCIKAKAVEVVKVDGQSRLRITPFGYESIMDYMATYPGMSGKLKPPVGPYTDEVYTWHSG